VKDHKFPLINTTQQKVCGGGKAWLGKDNNIELREGDIVYN
jgi:hypothetical protein